jgi:tryptophan synthase alpha subunit
MSERGAAGISRAFVRRPGLDAAFVAYITAGYPSKAVTVPALLALQLSGVSVIEVCAMGMTFP